MPIKEIQDDYVSEILNGFDISAILVPKDAEYLKFKDQIKEKFQIHQHLKHASDSVIQQLEAWWDKYGVSLNQIDDEMKYAEANAHVFLRSYDMSRRHDNWTSVSMEH